MKVDDFKDGEIYYNKKKDCYVLVVGRFHSRGTDYVATRTTQVNNPGYWDTAMGLSEKPGDFSVPVACVGGEEITLTFGYDFIRNFEASEVEEYLSDKVAQLSDKKFEEFMKNLKAYEHGQSGER